MKNIFIEQSKAGRNPWYLIPVILVGLAIGLIGFNQILNKLIIPWMKSQDLKFIFDASWFSFIMIGMVFTVLFLIFKYIFQWLTKRPLRSVITTEQLFNWTRFVKGFLLWGGLLLLCQTIIIPEAWGSFVQNFDPTNFALAFVIGGLGLLVQTFVEELVFRGFLLQTLGRKMNPALWANIIISSLFAFAHLGYGIDSFITSCTFSVVLVLVTLHDKGIERASGLHFANNFLLLMFFQDVNEAITETFSWDIDWADMGLHTLSLLIFYWLSVRYKTKASRRKTLIIG